MSAQLIFLLPLHVTKHIEQVTLGARHAIVLAADDAVVLFATRRDCRVIVEVRIRQWQRLTHVLLAVQIVSDVANGSLGVSWHGPLKARHLGVQMRLIVIVASCTELGLMISELVKRAESQAELAISALVLWHFTNFACSINNF